MKYSKNGIDLTSSFSIENEEPSNEHDVSNKESAIIADLKASQNKPKSRNGLKLFEIPISQIRSTNNPRKFFDEAELKGLAKNIKDRGLLQPIGVRKHSDHYELIWGERRLKAFKINKEETIPAFVADIKQIPPETIQEVKLLENLQRKDLTDSETAIAIFNICNERGYKIEKLAEILRKSEDWVNQKITHAKLINKLSEETKNNPKLNSYLFSLPTTTLVDLQSSLKKDKGSVFNLLEEHAISGTILKKQEVRSFSKSLKNETEDKKDATKDKSAFAKTLSADQLKKLINGIEKKIDNLNTEKSIYESALAKIAGKKSKKTK
ncbi:ParB/RepB/Spo0J family partition protein [Leptospira kmetyi]|uniref:ParB/RepB/Spo0J family partition protein n=1 Tax=Leptospira kmetyi TaxID=408139 RepID=UPI0003906774|nr:ParB/RepB/Spo0J family partition protein [Leptospira kmetyi]EQA55378.1 ParB-like protein [Leptospira kmetyi serovar Malaysia str. Bejo-Iso9]